MTIETNPPLVIGHDQMARLENMASAQMARNPALADRLLQELGRASTIADSELPADVVRLGSRIIYRDESKGKDEEISLVWPEEADISQGRISILTPLGVALIGLREGAHFFWETRREVQRKLLILQVTPPAG